MCLNTNMFQNMGNFFCLAVYWDNAAVCFMRILVARLVYHTCLFTFFLYVLWLSECTVDSQDTLHLYFWIREVYILLKQKAVIVGVVLLTQSEISSVVFNGIFLLCSVSDKHTFHIWPCQWKFSGSTSSLHRTLSTVPSHKLFTNLHQQLSKSGFFGPWTLGHGRPWLVQNPEWKFTYWEQWNKLQAPVSK